MTTATHTLTLSQTSTPFPFSTLAAASFLNAQPSSTTEAQSAPTVEIVWEKDAKSVKLDGKDVSEEAALDVFSKELKGKETAFPTLPTPLTAKVPFAEVTQIFDALDDFLALRTFFGGHQLGAKDFSVWGAIKTNLPAIGILKKKTHNHLARWYNYVDSLTSTQEAVAALAAAKASKAPKGGKVAEKGDKPEVEKREITLDLPGAVDGGVVTRFPPEPSGYLHIGHSKAALLNRYFADKYHGKMILRFDDTNPLKERSEFEQSIKEDLELLNIKFDQVTYTSDHFDKLHEIAIQLIKAGKAYCDDTPQEEMRRRRMDGIASDRREESVEDSLKRFDEMTAGSDEGQKWCLRAKMSVDDPNKAMRDTVIYRCVKQAHHRTGTKYFSYPTYDFACPVVDSLEGVTHALRTNEYRDRNPQYMWFIDALNIRKPNLWDFSRLNFVYTLLSKRKLHQFVNDGQVTGWDDARFPTVRGIRRRGLTIEALKEFIILQGASQSQMTMEWDGIWTINKRIIDPIVPRYCALATKDLVKVEISGGPSGEETKSLPRHKKNADLGEKSTVYSSTIYVEQVDAASFDDNEEVTLMDWGNAYVRSKTVSSTGVVTGLKMDLHLEGDFKKTKKKVTWLSSPSSSNPTTPLTLIDYDYLITKKKLEDTDSASDFITPTTEFREDAMGDSNVLKDVKKGDTVQFERKGYYICDSVGGEGEKSEAKRWEFIAIPDGRAGSVESKEVARREREAKAAKAAKGGAATGAVEGGEKKKSKKAEKKEAAAAGAEGGAKKGGKKAAAPEAKPAALSETKVVKSEGTAGFEIPVSTTMYPVSRVYGEEEIATGGETVNMYNVKPYTETSSTPSQ